MNLSEEKYWAFRNIVYAKIINYLFHICMLKLPRYNSIQQPKHLSLVHEVYYAMKILKVIPVALPIKW
jgi:hypothetical protein